MKNATKRSFWAAALVFLIFLLFTAVVCKVDVRAIGPEGSEVGLAGLNGTFFAALGGYHPFWYGFTEGMGVAVLLIVASFGLLGLVQLIHGKSFKAVDPDLYVLGGLYLVVGAAYLLFKLPLVNLRPVILDAEEGLEASFPSSHTIMAVFVLSTAAMQLRTRLKKEKARRITGVLCAGLMVLMIVGRFWAGVHWFTDIIAALLFGLSLVLLYKAIIRLLHDKEILS